MARSEDEFNWKSEFKNIKKTPFYWIELISYNLSEYLFCLVCRIERDCSPCTRADVLIETEPCKYGRGKTDL